MKLKTIAVTCIATVATMMATQAQTWNVGGNAVGAASKVGTTTNFPMQMITNNATRMTISSAGKVGIGTTVPSVKLHVQQDGEAIRVSGTNSLIQVANGTNTPIGYMWNNNGDYQVGVSSLNPSGKLKFANATTNVLTIDQSNGMSFMGTYFNELNGKDLQVNAPLSPSFQFTPGDIFFQVPKTINQITYKAGKVGIGTTDAALGKLVVEGTAGNTVALFRKNSTGAGVSIISDWPGIYFNSYFNGTQKAMSPGYSGMVNFDPVSGKVVIGSSATAAAAAGDAVSVPEAIIINKSGNVGIGGVTYSDTRLHVTTGAYRAIRGETTFSSGNGIEGIANGGNATYAVYGESNAGGWAGFFLGNVAVTGTFNNASDARLKENIQPVENAIRLISRLDAKTYNFKAEYARMNLPKGNQFGLIAQEVEKVLPDLIVTNYDKSMDKEHPFEYKGINYIGLIPVLTQAIKEQNTINEKLITENAELKSQIYTMNECVQSLCNSQTSKIVSTEITNNALFQNQPNPFNQSTVIAYQLASEVKNAAIVIRGLSGEELKSITLSNSGKGQATINANELAQGTYTYTLIVNGKSVDTKLMVVTK